MSNPGKPSLDQTIREQSGRLLGFIRRRVRNPSDAEDILQEVWYQFTLAVDLSPIEQVSAWLYRVARNRIIDRARRKSPDAATAAADAGREEAPEDWLADEQTPRSEYARRQFWDRLRSALAELPPEQRQVFVWHELEGRSFEEMAALTGENRNTLLSRKRYAVRRLRERLEPLREEFL